MGEVKQVSAQDDKREKVYKIIVTSQKTGITIDQISKQLGGDILAPRYGLVGLVGSLCKLASRGLLGWYAGNKKPA